MEGKHALKLVGTLPSTLASFGSGPKGGEGKEVEREVG